MNFLGKWEDDKLDKILIAIIKQIEIYQIKRIALKAPHPSHSSPQLHALINDIMGHAKAKRISCKTYSIEQLHRHYCPTEYCANREHLMDQVMRQYPFVWSEHSKEKRNKRWYYLKLFEAIAVAQFSTGSRYK